MSRPSGPRIRTVKPERYHDERLAAVSRDARHLYDGLTTQADDEGRGTANLALIRADVLPFDDDATPERIASWLRDLEAAGLIVLYDAGGRSVLAIVSWADDQRVDKPTPSRLPPPPDVPRDSSRAIANVPAGPGPGPDRDQDHSLSTEASREGEGDVIHFNPRDLPRPGSKAAAS